MKKIILCVIVSMMSFASVFAEDCTNFSGQWTGVCKSLDVPTANNPGTKRNLTITQNGCSTIEMTDGIKKEEFPIGQYSEDFAMRWNNDNTMLVFKAIDDFDLLVMGSLVLDGTSLVIDAYETAATFSRCIFTK